MFLILSSSFLTKLELQFHSVNVRVEKRLKVEAFDVSCTRTFEAGGGVGGTPRDLDGGGGENAIVKQELTPSRRRCAVIIQRGGRRCGVTFHLSPISYFHFTETAKTVTRAKRGAF